MFALTEKPIRIGELLDSVTRPGAGAIVTFIGTTRDHNEGRKVLALSYEAYPGMAEQELERIAVEAKKKWAIEEMAIVHRTGRVDIGQVSVAIAVSAAHREDAFAACRFAIEEIKRKVPIWKKELFEGGELWIGTQSGQRFHTEPGAEVLGRFAPHSK
ncbi:MAG TPA: molybdenum cofactor biosynthesis protein MoaE [Candidatus Acidoferrales bacterium]|nr:molybdenum cofactor biosynthesis protein MoaE [Candidatus Acidoferrales bacterium]